LTEWRASGGFAFIPLESIHPKARSKEAAPDGVADRAAKPRGERNPRAYVPSLDVSRANPVVGVSEMDAGERHVGAGQYVVSAACPIRLRQGVIDSHRFEQGQHEAQSRRRPRHASGTACD
jgi:hypothetical protein